MLFPLLLCLHQQLASPSALYISCRTLSLYPFVKAFLATEKEIVKLVKKLHYFLKYILTNFPPFVLIHYKIQIFSYTQSSLNLNILVNVITKCKVEFNQPSCWLYSVPNLLVI